MPFESHDWWMAGAIVAACLTLYAVSRWLYYDRRQRGIQAEFNGLSPDRDYGRVRARNPAVRMSTVHDRKTEEQYEQIDESRRPNSDGLGRTGPNTRADVCLSATLPMPADAAKPSGATTAAQAERNSPKAGASATLADSHTNLVPFERGYAFNFSRRIR